MLHIPLLVLGTHNRKKSLELIELFEPLGIALRTLRDFPQAIVVEENGDSFAANAALKATQQAVHLNAWVLGEDSGLSVDALGGKPGIYSARFAGPQATDDDNNRRLLSELIAIPLARRTAHYTCHAALSDSAGNIVARSEGYCRGRIRFEASGNGGFGYDPYFEIVEYHRTFADLGQSAKQVLSHRARAIRQLVATIAELER